MKFSWVKISFTSLGQKMKAQYGFQKDLKKKDDKHKNEKEKSFIIITIFRKP